MILGPEHVSEAGSRESKGLGDVSSIHKGPPKILDKLLPSPVSYLPSSMNAVVLLLWSQSTKLVAPFRLAGLWLSNGPGELEVCIFPSQVRVGSGPVVACDGLAKVRVASSLATYIVHEVEKKLMHELYLHKRRR